MPKFRGNTQTSAKRNQPAGKVVALQRWPKAPASFSSDERACWDRLGKACISTGTVSEGDLILAEGVARLMAKVDDALSEREVPGNLASLMRLMSDQLHRLGLSPASRTSLGPLPVPKRAKANTADEFGA